MTMPDTRRSPLVDDYLRRLELAARRLAPDQRAELVDGISEHLDSALEAVDPDDEASTRVALDRLGTPDEIVAAAAEGDSPAGRRGWSNQTSAGPDRPSVGAKEIVTVILLALGGFLFVVGWFVGVAMLWASDRWSTRDKIVGTLVWPGGYLFPLAFGLFAARVCTSVSDPIRSTGAESQSCTGWAMPIWLGVPVVVILFLAPIATVAYLLARAGRSR